MTNQEIRNYLRGLEKKLLSGNSVKEIKLTREWTKQFPTDAGVYIIIEGYKICYVGESGSIRARMRDLLETRNHVLRRSIGNSKFQAIKSFQKATSYKKFIKEIESKLNNWIERNLKVSTLVVNLGRKELEEFIFEKHEPKYNNKGKRSHTT